MNKERLSILPTTIETTKKARSLVEELLKSEKKRVQHIIRRTDKNLNFKDKHRVTSAAFLEEESNTVYGMISFSSTYKYIDLEQPRDTTFTVVLDQQKNAKIYFRSNKKIAEVFGVKFLFKTIETIIKKLSDKIKEENERTEKMIINRKNWKGYYIERTPISPEGEDTCKKAIKDCVFSREMGKFLKDNEFNVISINI